MTVAMAWTRQIATCEELVFCSDSRLSGDGRTIDVCQKVITLPRSDCAIAFAGYTGDAFPLMHQLATAIAAHEPLRRGSLDIQPLLTHTLKIFTGLASAIKDASPGMDLPSVEFIFGGYSWIKKRFRIWNIRYDSEQHAFVAFPARQYCAHPKAQRIFTCRQRRRSDVAHLGLLAVAGDQGSNALDRLNSLIVGRAEGKRVSELEGFNMEPFEVVRDMLRDGNKAPTIGGAPQVVKVYQYMQSAPLGVFWPSKDAGVVHLAGRPIQGYENVDRWIIDPDALRSELVGRSKFREHVAADAADER